MWLLVGLGNPGPKYAQNRHNVGFLVIDEIARRWRTDGETWQKKFGGDATTAFVGGARGEKAILLKPMEFMNVSGRAVQRAAAFYQVEAKNIVVIHDEIDLDLGRLKLKSGGGHAGHNGLRSLVQELGSPDFVRVRVGVGRPPGRQPVADFVLGDFPKAEQENVGVLLREAADAVEEIVQKGPLLAMNKWNARAEELL